MGSAENGARQQGFTIFGAAFTAPSLAAGLTIVATPIGALSDITLRAVQVLAAADLVLCEDTRISSRLLSHYGIRAPLRPYHDHNAAEERPKILALLAQGKRVALISDAGTPLISDPGYKLVEAARAAGIAVTAAPGPSAVMAALCIAGLPTDAFFFAGFLPTRQEARKKRLTQLQSIPATLVIFETGPRIADSLHSAAAVLGAREAAVCRELTKLHEEVRRAPLAELAAHYAGEAETRGEFVLVIGPPPEETADAGSLDALLREALASQGVKAATEAVAALTGLGKRQVYQRALQLKDE